ncbi:FadR/GntR family transcriptional regulator [Dermabacter sp. HSID17554]|uniref:FadR/GntR family transcriptional regulator n=1 Tax=Dermabacter sp. HSID17554 TaxID=2419511 RepID=UPI001EE8DD7F|nr:GntR family transcriptional regulator [Dermabacter sp. HSID17554]
MAEESMGLAPENRERLSKRRTASNATVDAIKEYILEHHLRPGDPLPTEASLQGTLGVSRSSVREALRTLQSLDIVSIQHGRGMSVGELSFAPMIEAVLFRARLNAKDDLSTLREVVEVRMALDLALTDELIEVYRGSSQPKLREHVKNMRECVEAGRGFASCDEAFHSDLLAATSNHMMQQLGMAFWRIHTVAVPAAGLPQAKDISDTVNAHDAIIDALVAGDATAYRAAVIEHYRPLRRLLEVAAN